MFPLKATDRGDNGIEHDEETKEDKEPHFVRFHSLCFLQANRFAFEDHTVSSSLFRLDHEAVQLLFSFQQQREVATQQRFEIFYFPPELMDACILTQFFSVDIVMVHGGSQHRFEFLVHGIAIGIAYPTFGVPTSKIV